MIEIRQLSKTFRQKHSAFRALDNINLELAEGEILGIIGSSGAGKSTLIRCVNLLEKPLYHRTLSALVNVFRSIPFIILNKKPVYRYGRE